jgi:hypothetical protein
MKNDGAVGPVLQSGAMANVIVAAIQALNPSAMVLDRGAYVRVLVPRRCVLTREALERELGSPFHLPQDLEVVMTSFKGTLTLGESEAVWEVSEVSP